MSNLPTKVPTPDTTPSASDLIYKVNDPYGTPADDATTLANAVTKAHGLSDGVLAISGGTMAVAANTAALAATQQGYTTAEQTKLAGIETNADVTDATNVDAAGAVMNSDSSTAAMSFVVDEDDMASDSATKIPTQQSVKAYVDTLVTGLLDFKGSTDASTNPNYPAALKGDAYVISVAGKVGGASGKSVDVGDMYIAIADNAGGTEASVGTNWIVLEHNLSGALLAANNLSDISSASTARTNLGLAIGTDVQGYDADLAALAGLSGVQGDIIYRDASQWQRLPKGTANQELRMNSGATAPEWYTPSGGASTPRMRFILTEESNPLGSSSSGRIDVASSGTGASTAYGSTTGLQLVGASVSGTTGYATAYPTKQRNGKYIETVFFDKNPTFFGRIALYSNTGGKMEFGMGIGSLTANTGFDGTTTKTLHFRLVRTTAGGLIIYAVSGTGSAETATNITTAATATTGWIDNATNHDQLFVIDYTSGVEAKFYINGTLMATHTTNLPTGSVTSANNVLAAKVHNNTDTSASSQVHIYSMFAEFDAI